jgi:hypothetical protein
MFKALCQKPEPFALSLSKGCPSLIRRMDKKEQGFDKLSPNGSVVQI